MEAPGSPAVTIMFNRERSAVSCRCCREIALEVSWQGKVEGTPLTFLTFHPDLPTVGLDNCLTDYQAQPGSFVFGDLPARELAVLFEETTNFLRWDAYPVVFHPYPDLRAISHLIGTHLYLSPIACEFYSVTQEVAQHLIETAGVGFNARKRCRNGAYNGNVSISHQR